MNPTTSDTAPAAPKNWWLLGLALAAFLCFGLRTISNSAVWMHLASGRVIAQEGRPHSDPFAYTTDTTRPWINTHWLYDAGLYRLWEGLGPSGVVVLNALLGLLAVLAALRSGRTGVGQPASLLTLLATGWLIAPVFQVGPALPAMALLGLFMMTLERSGAKPVAWALLLPAQLVWTNLHGSFLIGPLLALVYALQAWWAGRGTANPAPTSTGPGRLLGLAAGLALVSLVNPYGFGLHRHVWAAFTHPGLGVLIEWISPFQSEFAPAWPRHASTVVLIIIACGFVFIRDRLPIATTLLAVVGAFLLVVSPRYVAFSALLVAPFCSLSLANLGRILNSRPAPAPGPDRRAPAPAAALITALCLFTLVYVASNGYYVRTGSAASFGTTVNSGLLPAPACLELISQPGFPDRAVNLAMDGGYLVWKVPGHKVFADTRVGVYGALYYQGMARALLGQAESWSNLLQRWDPGAVILNGSWPGAGAALRRLVDDPQWALAYFDGLSAVVVRRTAGNESFLHNNELQRAGLETLDQTLRGLSGTRSGWRCEPGSPRLMGAGAAYLALGRFSEARAIYAALMPRMPFYTTGWMNLGLCELQARNYESAVAALRKATSQRPEAPLGWLWLGKAYEAMNLPAEAEAARGKAIALNKGIAEAFEKGLHSPTNPPPTLPATKP